eukprot:7056381-Ditylum_brightwellii.AAC.1
MAYRKVHELTLQLEEIIIAKSNLFVPEKPEIPISCRSNTAIPGKSSNQAKELDQIVSDKKSVVDKSAREKWRTQESEEIGSIHESMQQICALAVDKSSIGTCIGNLSWFDMDNTGSNTILRWCS